MKRYWSVGICILMLLMVSTQLAFAEELNVVVDGFNVVNFPDQKPYIDDNNRVLVPVRFVSEELGGKVQWDSSSEQVTITHGGDEIRLLVGSSQAVIRRNSFERHIEMGTAAVLNNGRVMAPLRFITENMGYSVRWVESLRVVIIEAVIPKIPDQKLLEEFAQLDAEFSKVLSEKEGYLMMKDWNDSEVTRTSSGKFTDYIINFDVDKLGDSFFFEYDTQGNNNIAWASIYFSTDESQRNFFYYDMSTEIIQNKGHVIVNREQFRVGEGTPSWDNVKYFRVAFQSKPNTIFTIEPKNLATYNGGGAMVTLWFDDGWENAYTNAYSIASRIDPSIRGVIPIVPSAIGADGYLSEEQLTSLRNEGWEIVNHSYSHLYLTALSDDEIRDEVQKSFSFISEYDPAGAYHFAVPFSAVDDRVLEVLKENTLSIRYLGEEIDPIPFDRFNLGYKEVTNFTDFETIKGWIDEAIENKQWLGLMFHRIEDPADDRYSYGTKEFERLIYYLSFMKDDIKAVTVTEAFKEVGLPIKLSNESIREGLNQ